MRLRLLEPRRHPHLLKCILGLAMLLPQTTAFYTLREKIHATQTALLLDSRRPKVVGGAVAPASQKMSILSWTLPLPGKVWRSMRSANIEEHTDARAEVDIHDLLKRFDEITSRAQY